jgi:hypothetical protein
MIGVTGASAIIAAAIGAAGSIYSQNRSENAQRELYNQSQADQWADIIRQAEAGVGSARRQGSAAVEAARAQAEAAIAAAGAEAGAIVAGATAEAQAAEKAANIAFEEAVRNVELHEKESAEVLRRLENEQTVIEEKARAKAAASGGTMAEGTSSQTYVTAMEEENTTQYENLEEAYKSQRGVAIENAAGAKEAAFGYASALLTGARAMAGAVRASGHIMGNAYMRDAQTRAQAMMDQALANWRQTRDWNNQIGQAGRASAARQQSAERRHRAATQQQTGAGI